MQGELSTTPQPALDEATRSFVRRTLSAGLVELDDLKKVVVSLMAEDNHFTPKRLAQGLIGAGVLTQWQASKLLAGKSRGFYLGSYRLLRPLGRGGMGVVYLGEHHVMKRLMALKILPPEATKDKRRIERFKSEARACAQLDHPNIVRAYDFAEAGEKLYIVMEYVDGIDLHYAVQRDGVMSAADAIDVLTQATRGLAHAHERGILHRDIKPSNLLLRTDGVIKVSDLGLARIGWTDGDQEQQRLMGTVDFLAPEQAINSAAVDTRGDIYALGCTFYYLLTGRPPYEGTTAQRLARHQTEAVPDIRALRPDCPAAIAELALRMMAKRPADRPKSAVELLGQLGRLGGAGGDSSRKALRHVAPAGDTVIDEALYQATIDDTSLSADGEVVIPVAAVEIEQFDFADLPPVDLSAAAGPPPQPALRPAVQPNKPLRPGGAKHQAAAKPMGIDQNLLLGVGLAIALMAMVAVLILGVYSLTRPLEQPSPKIKTVEDGRGGQVIIVRE
jgi:serine/threonine-protein kinase